MTHLAAKIRIQRLVIIEDEGVFRGDWIQQIPATVPTYLAKSSLELDELLQRGFPGEEGVSWRDIDLVLLDGSVPNGQPGNNRAGRYSYCTVEAIPRMRRAGFHGYIIAATDDEMLRRHMAQIDAETIRQLLNEGVEWPDVEPDTMVLDWGIKSSIANRLPELFRQEQPA